MRRVDRKMGYFKRWIMSFGQHAVVLAPDSLQADIVQEFTSLLAAYSQGPAPLGPESSKPPDRRPSTRSPR